MKVLAPVLLGATFAACTLTIDTDGLSGGTPDAGLPTSTDAGGRADADAAAPKDAAGPCKALTDSDPRNCGACGRDCLGGACTKGVCGWSTIARGFDNPLGVGVTATKVYLGHDGGLVELDLDGKNPRTVVPDLHVHYIHATDADVFFTESSTNALRRWKRSGGDAVVLAKANQILGVTLSPTHLFYSRYADPGAGGGVYRLTYPNIGEPQTLFSYDRSETIDWSGGKLFVGSDGSTNNVITIDDDGTGEKKELVAGGGPTGVCVSGTDVFVARQRDGQILRVPMPDGKAEILVEEQDRPSGIVATANALYWVEEGSGTLDVLVR